ncbi:hypothetical protein ACFWRG_09845 [Micromonospora tulbaghiae]|uniref:hypothetical protein n=1 Tax=Micromonospora tulbaghiae TaxID=479978 RepID=UPI003648CF4E
MKSALGRHISSSPAEIAEWPMTVIDRPAVADPFNAQLTAEFDVGDASGGSRLGCQAMDWGCTGIIKVCRAGDRYTDEAVTVWIFIEGARAGFRLWYLEFASLLPDAPSGGQEDIKLVRIVGQHGYEVMARVLSEPLNDGTHQSPAAG